MTVRKPTKAFGDRVINNFQHRLAQLLQFPLLRRKWEAYFFPPPWHRPSVSANSRHTTDRKIGLLPSSRVALRTLFLHHLQLIPLPGTRYLFSEFSPRVQKHLGNGTPRRYVRSNDSRKSDRTDHGYKPVNVCQLSSSDARRHTVRKKERKRGRRMVRA